MVKKIPDSIKRGRATLFKVRVSEQKRKIEAEKRSWRKAKPYLTQRTVKIGRKHVLYVGAA